MKNIPGQFYLAITNCYAEHRGDELLISVQGKSEIVVLTETAIDLWHLLSKKRSVDELVQELCKEYEVSVEQAARDVKQFLKKGIDNGIVTKT